MNNSLIRRKKQKNKNPTRSLCMLRETGYKQVHDFSTSTLKNKNGIKEDEHVVKCSAAGKAWKNAGGETAKHLLLPMPRSSASYFAITSSLPSVNAPPPLPPIPLSVLEQLVEMELYLLQGLFFFFLSSGPEGGKN